MDIALRYFYEAADCGSMRLASEKIGVAVSSVSRQIAQLEQEMGIALIEKNRRNIKLTEAGELVFDYYRGQRGERQTLLERIQALRGMHRGSVHLSVGEGFLSEIFLESLGEFQKSNPGLSISVTVESTIHAVRRVLDDESHVGLVFQVPNEPKIRVRAAVTQPLLVVCRPDHPIAALGTCTLEDLSKHSLALVPRGTRMREMLAAAEAKRGIWLEASLVSNSIYTLRELARLGEVATILPRTSVISEVRTGLLVAVPIAEPELEVTEIAIITRLGRQLGEAPARMLPMIEAKLRLVA